MPWPSWRRPRWEVRQMAKVYYNLIHVGLRTIDQVPALWRAAVQAMLDGDAE